MDLHYLFVGGKSLYDLGLELGTRAVLSCRCIDTYRQDNTVTLEDHCRNLACQNVDLMRRHAVRHADVERAYHHVRAVIVQNDIEYALDALDTHQFFLDLFNQIGRYPGPKQFIHRRSQHFDTSFYDYKRDQSAQDSVQGEVPDEHYTCRYKRGGGDDRIEQCIRTGCYKRIAAELLALPLDVESQHQLDGNGHDNNYKGCRCIARMRRFYDLLYRLDKR